MLGIGGENALEGSSSASVKNKMGGSNRLTQGRCLLGITHSFAGEKTKLSAHVNCDLRSGDEWLVEREQDWPEHGMFDGIQPSRFGSAPLFLFPGRGILFF